MKQEVSTSRIRVGLLGQPNTGKSTLFNALTGSNQHVGNWPGKTVEKKEGKFQHQGKHYALLDLPGTYSLSANSEEELITRNSITSDALDIILVLIDASQMERSMFLLAEMVGMRCPVVVLLNMMDTAEMMGRRVDVDHLSLLLGVPVLPFVASRKKGLDALLELLDREEYASYQLRENALREQYESSFGQLFTDVEKRMLPLETESCSALWLSAKLLERDRAQLEGIRKSLSAQDWSDLQTLVDLPEDGLLSSADAKFNWLHSIAGKVTLSKGKKRGELNRFDRVAISPTWGKWIALGIVGLGVMLSFKIGYFFMGLVGSAWGWSMGQAYGFMATLHATPFVTGFVCDALITSLFYSIMMAAFVLGMLLVFNFIEEVGYLARVSYVFDVLMQKIGLQGKAIMPFLLCFGCTIAGVAGTRVLDSAKQRFLTIALSWVIPCSAVWGVISLMSSTFFGKNAVWVILLLFVVALFHLLLTATILSRLLNSGEEHIGLIMELPPYRLPHWRNFLRNIWLRASGIFAKASKVIVAVTVIFWTLSYTPDGNISSSLLYKAGMVVEPYSMLFGLNWELFIAVLISAIGKESALGVITTLFARHAAMGNVYNAAFLGSGIASGNIAANLLAGISVPQALAFMFAFFFNVPCFMTVATTYGELHRIKWTVGLVLYYFIFSLLMAGVVYRIALLFF